MPTTSRSVTDVTRTDWANNIRKYVVRADHLDDLVALGSLTPVAARFLAASVTAGLNVLVSGPTHAGSPTRPQSTLSDMRPQMGPRGPRVSGWKRSRTLHTYVKSHTGCGRSGMPTKRWSECTLTSAQRQASPRS